MRLSSLSSSHVSSFRFTLIPPKTDLSRRSTFSTTCLSMARFSARSSRLALSGLRPKCPSNQQPTAQRTVKRANGVSPLDAGYWLLVAGTLRAKRAEAVESLRAESRELLLMVGKSINTASARMQGKAIGA